MSGIVVGIEETAEGRAAVAWALREAARRRLPLYAVRAWPDAVRVGARIPRARSPDWTEQEAARVVHRVVREVAAETPGVDELDVRTCPLRGPAGPALARVAAGHVLLVVGTRRARVASRVLPGSVTQHVLHHARCPVAVVPAPAWRAARPLRVVVGVDHSPESLSALAWAADEADRHRATLVPVLVREDVGAAATTRTPLRAEELGLSERHALRDAVPADVRVPIAPDVIAGPPGKALAQYAEPHDLLVVGSRGRHAVMGAALGSTSSYLAEHAHCPVVVVRGGEAG